MVSSVLCIYNTLFILLAGMREPCLFSYRLASSTPPPLDPADTGMLINSMSYFYKKEAKNVCVFFHVKLIEENFCFDVGIENKIPV